MKVSLQQYKTLHVTLSLIICVMDHCFRARPERLWETLIGSNSPSSASLFPFAKDTPSGKADNMDNMSYRIRFFKLMIVCVCFCDCDIYFITTLMGPNKNKIV